MNRRGGGRAPGPGAQTVLVFETPAAALPLAQRVGAHAALLRRLAIPCSCPTTATEPRPCRARRAPKALFNEAIGLIQAGRLADAEARCRAALERYAATSTCRRCSAPCWSRWSGTRRPRRLLREVIDAAPTFAKPREDLGYLLLQANRAADALPLLERATRLDPSLERAWFSLGKALALLGRGKEADAAFEKSFALSPERRLMALAAEHQKEGRIEEAERLYRRVLRNNPRNVDALRLLALHRDEGRSAGRGRDAAQRAIEIAPDFLLALLDLGRLRKDQDRYAEALECFDRVIALEPAQPQAHFLRAATLARASFTQEAIDCLPALPGAAGRPTSARCWGSATS